MNDKLSAMKNAVNVGQKTTRHIATVKMIVPINIPVFRPRLSATDASSGLIKPINERVVTA